MAEQLTVNLFTRGQDDAGENPWDDTLLVEQYDKCVTRLKEKVAKLVNEGKESEDSDKGKHTERKYENKNKWEVGMYCRAKYTEDNIFYEASILAVDCDTGTCKVKYIGYENEEELPLDCLTRSNGRWARKLQEDDAAQDKVQVDGEVKPAIPEALRHSDEKQGRRRWGSPLHFDRKIRRLNSTPEMTQSTPGPCMLGENFPDAFAFVPPPMPHPHPTQRFTLDDGEALSAMLMSWYMNGYHTGYYQALQHARGHFNKYHDLHQHKRRQQ